MSYIEEKALRLVADGRVTIKWRSGDYAAGHGTVDGDHDTYHCSFSPEGRVCTCPSVRDCSHALALELAVAWQQFEIGVM